MAIFQKNFGSGDATLILNVSETGTSAATNKGKISWSLQVRMIYNGKSWSNGGATIRVIIGGTERYLGKSFDLRGVSAGSTKTIASGDFTAEHASNGTLTLSCAASFSSGVSLGNANINDTFTGTTIPRATTPTLSKTTVNLGESVIINLPRKDSTFTHKLFYSINSKKTWTTIATKVGTSHSWEVPKAIAESFPSNTSGTINIRCTTYNGTTQDPSTQIGASKDVNLRFTIPDTMDFKPSISSIAVEEVAAKKEEWTYDFAFPGVFVKDLSKLGVTVTASGKYDSTIKYKTTVDGVSYSSASFTSNVLRTSGTLTIKTIVTDSRGKTAEKTKDITIEPYSPPAITSFTYLQCNADGKPNSTGTSTKVTITGKVSSVKNANGEELNSVKRVSLKWKEGKDADYTNGPIIETSEPPLIVTRTGLNFTAEYIVNGTSADKTYQFRAVLTDENKGVPREISTGVIALSCMAGGKGVAIGKEAEKVGVLESAFPIRAPYDNVLTHGDEFNVVPAGYEGQVWINGRTASGAADGAITQYVMGNGAGGFADVRGNIIVSESNGNTVHIGSQNTAAIHFVSSSKPFYFNYNLLINGRLDPNTNGKFNIGQSTKRWNTAFFTNSITASDLKEKDVIEDFDFKVEDFILNLKPIAYRRTGEGDRGKRIHLGFGAQDVAKIITDLDIGDMSMVQASIVEEETVDIENDEGITETVTEIVESPYYGEEIDDEKLSWGINYSELIAPMVLMIQKQEERIKELEAKLK